MQGLQAMPPRHFNHSIPSNKPAPAAIPITAGEFISNGLVLAFKFDEGSGQVANDLSPSKLHGQLGSTSGADANDPTWISPRGLAFNNQYVTVLTPNTALRLTTALSIEAKFKWTSGQGGIYDKTGAGVTNQNYQLMVDGGLKFRLIKGAGNNDLTGTTFTSTCLYHVVATWDGAEMVLYVDGQKAFTHLVVTPSIDNVDGDVLIGKLGSGVFPFIGNIYKIGIYNRALSAIEVRTAYELS